MKIFIFYLIQFIWKSNEKNLEKKNYLLNNNFQNNYLIYNNHLNNSTYINEDKDYLINNSDYYNFSHFSETKKYIFFQIKLCENENISYNISYENESNIYIKNDNYSKDYLYKIEEINYENLSIKQIYFPDIKNQLLFRYHYLNTNHPPNLINNFEYDIKIVNKYIYIEFLPLIDNEIIDYIIVYSKNKTIGNECYLYNILQNEIPEDIEIFYYSFLTNNSLIVKLDVTIFNTSIYYMNIIAEEKNNHKIKIAYGLKEFQYILKSYIIENQLYVFEEEKIIFKILPDAKKNRKYLIQWNDSTNEEKITIYQNETKIDEWNNTNKINYLFVPINKLYHIIYQSQSIEKEIYFDIFDEYGKFFDDKNEYSIVLHNNTEISFYTDISKYGKNEKIIFCVYLQNIQNLSNYNYTLFNKNNYTIENKTSIFQPIYENISDPNLFYIIVEKEEFNNIQINFKIEVIDKMDFKENKTVYIKYLNYIKIKNENITEKNMIIPKFYIINRTELINTALIFYTQYINIFEIYYGYYIIGNEINKNKKQQNIQVFDYSNNISQNIIIIKAFNKEDKEKGFQIIDSFTNTNLSYLISEKRENFIKNYRCEKHLLILNIYNQQSNDKLIFIKKKNNNLEFHLSNNFNNFQTLESVYESNETIIDNIKKLENMIDLFYIKCDNNGEFTLYQLSTNDPIINDLESSSLTYFYLENSINLTFNDNLKDKEINLEFNLIYDKNSNVSIYLDNNFKLNLNNNLQKGNFSFTYTNNTNLTIFNHQKNENQGSLLNVIIGLNENIIHPEINTTYNREINDKIILIYNPEDTKTKEVRLSIKSKDETEICLNIEEGVFPFLYFLKENCEILYSNSSKNIIVENKLKKNNINYISILTSKTIYLNYTYVMSISNQKENISKINYDGITQFQLENKKNYLFYQITPCYSHKQMIKINSNEYTLSNKTNFNFIYNIETNKTNEIEFLNGSCLFHFLTNITTKLDQSDINRDNLKINLTTNSSSKTFKIEFNKYTFLTEYYIIMTNNISLFDISNPCFLYEIINNISKNANISIDKKYSTDNNIHFVDTKFFNSTIYITIVGKKTNIPDIIIYYDIINTTFNYIPSPSDSWFYVSLFMTIFAILLLIIYIHINYKRNNDTKNVKTNENKINIISNEMKKSARLVAFDNIE